MSGGRSNTRNLLPRGQPSARSSGGAGTNGEDIVVAGSDERQFMLEHACTRVLGWALVDRCGDVVHPNSTANGVGWGLVQSFRECRIAALELGNGDCMLFSEDFLRTTLSIVGEVVVGGDVAIQALMPS